MYLFLFSLNSDFTCKGIIVLFHLIVTLVYLYWVYVSFSPIYILEYMFLISLDIDYDIHVSLHLLFFWIGTFVGI